tara:strand:+ start:851 stop:1339 length:489 start_codon:yes stop_codon:yes gene_type:complete
MAEQKYYKNNSNELIIQHFILAILIFFQSCIKVLNIIIPNPNQSKSDINQGAIKSSNNPHTILLEKSSDELRKIISDVDIISNLEKNQLTELILSSEEALDVIAIEERRDSLKKLTNHDIKSLLTGIEGISRFRKAELIEMVLKQERITNKVRRQTKRIDSV